MLSEQIKLNTLGFFDELYQAQLKLERAKADLLKLGLPARAYFGLIAGDKDQFGPLDLATFAKKKFVQLSEDELYSVYSYFDFRRKGVVTEPEFRRQLGLESNGSKGDEESAADLLASVLKVLKQNFRVFEVCRQAFFVQEDFYLPTLFRHLDSSTQGYLSRHEVQKFLRDNGKSPSQKETELIFRGLNPRMKKYNLEVFAETINPFEKGYYPGFSERLKEQAAVEEKRSQQQLKEEIVRQRIEEEKKLLQQDKLQRRKKLQEQAASAEKQKQSALLKQMEEQKARAARKEQIERERQTQQLAQQFDRKLQNNKQQLQEERIRAVELQRRMQAEHADRVKQNRDQAQLDLERDFYWNERAEKLEQGLALSQMELQDNRQRIRIYEDDVVQRSQARSREQSQIQKELMSTYLRIEAMRNEQKLRGR